MAVRMLAVVIFLGLSMNVWSQGTDEEAALAQREAEWLALRDNLCDKDSPEPDKAAAAEIRKILLAVRTIHPEVAHIKVPRVAMRDASIEMTVEGNESFPAELDALIKMGSSSTIQYGETEDDPVRLYIFFGRLLHVPTLVARASATPRVTDAREEGESFDSYDYKMTVQAHKYSDGDTWDITLAEKQKPMADPDWPERFHYYHFTIKLDRQVLASVVQPQVIGYGMDIKKTGETWDK